MESRAYLTHDNRGNLCRPASTGQKGALSLRLCSPLPNHCPWQARVLHVSHYSGFHKHRNGRTPVVRTCRAFTTGWLSIPVTDVGLTQGEQPLRSDSEREDVDHQEIVTKATPISQVAGVLRTKPHLIHPGDSIYTLALKVAWGACARLICVVDAEDRLVGIVPLRVALENVFYEVEGEERTASQPEAGDFPQAPRPLGAEVARELMEAPIWIRPGDTVKDAVDKMLATHLDGLPIVDDEMRVVGYVDAVELLRLWIGDHRQPTATAPV